MEAALTDLVERLKKALPDQLQSVILYGSGASGEHDSKFSDLNVFCVLSSVGVPQLRKAEPVFHWWRAQGHPAPLLMSEEEMRTSTDCFPIEFHDMLERRRVIFGRDAIAGLQVDRSFYRAQVEHELRAKLLRLRQKGAGLLSSPPGLLRLMADSVSTFIVLGRHALLLSGREAGWAKRGTVREFESIGVDGVPFSALLDFREQKIGEGQIDPAGLFGDYLKSVDALVAHVDRLDK